MAERGGDEARLITHLFPWYVTDHTFKNGRLVEHDEVKLCRLAFMNEWPEWDDKSTRVNV